MTTHPYQDQMHADIVRIIDTIGPRESCSAQEKRLAELLAEEWRPSCDEVKIEPFTCHPQAFLGFFPYVVLSYLAAIAFYWVFAPVSLLFAIVTLVLPLVQFALYRELIDRYFPEKESQNVVGRIKPRGAVKQRVIVSAHTDSAYEFILWQRWRKASPFIMAGGAIAVILLLITTAAKTAGLVLGHGDLAIFNVLGIICAALYPVVGLFAVWHVGTPVPGAMDDLSGIAILSALAKELHSAKSANEHTEVLLVGMGCEEAGLRGAKRYVTRHLAELKETPTYGLFVDNIGDERFLTVVPKELCTGARHSPKLVGLARAAAAEHNLTIATKMIPLGATDAAAFSLAGVPAVAILAQDMSEITENYHTRLDTPEHVRPEALGATLQLLLTMIGKLDKEASATL